MSDSEAHQRRVEREIAIFEGQEALHRHHASFDWRNEHFLRPRLEATFGTGNVHEIYARAIADAVARTGQATVFSLGCGDGEQELEVLRKADVLGLPPFAIYGLDLAPAVVARANAAAEAAGLAERFRALACEINAGLPGAAPVAAVMVHHALHHFVALEPILDSVAARLDANGVLVTFDMIGRNGHRRWPEVLPLVAELWDMLPDTKRHDSLFGPARPIFQDWDCAIEGFEGVRAEDILGLIAGRFVPEKFVAWGALSEVFVNPRMGGNFDPADLADRAFLDAVTRIEEAHLAARRTTPTEMAGVFRPRRSTLLVDPAAAADLDRALRRPGETFAPLGRADFPSPYPPRAPEPPPVLPAGTECLPQPGTPLAAALREGWLEAECDGVWAMLDSQVLRFDTAQPVSRVGIKVWNPLATQLGQRVEAVAEDCQAASSGPLVASDCVTLVLRAAAPRTRWRITLSAAAYRREGTDDSPDRRPLAYRLLSVTSGPAGASWYRLKGAAALLARLRERWRG